MANYGSLNTDATAILALLYAGMPATIPVFPASAEAGPQLVPDAQKPPYVSVHFWSRAIPDRMGRRSVRQVTRAYVHCVGANATAARQVHDFVSGCLLDVRPTIAGRTSGQIKADAQDTPPPSVDESTGTSVHTITDVYRLETTPG